MTLHSEDWERTLDVLEAKLSRHESALVSGRPEGVFEAMQLPSRTPSGGDRVRAQLALERIRRLEEELRRRQAAANATPRGRTSPYS